MKETGEEQNNNPETGDSMPKDSKPKNPKPKKKKKTALSYALEFFIKILVTAGVVAILTIYVVGIYVNHSNSNYPMIKDGDLCITYKLGNLIVGDEIAYLQDNQIRFGRIVAKTGDVVNLQEDYLTVNGYGVYEDAVYPTTAEGATISFPYEVPSGTVFVLNDYRSDPTDSRIYGGIPVKKTKGKIFLLLRRRGF